MEKVEEMGTTVVKMWLTDIEEKALQQVQNLASLPFVYHHIALMPDCHAGMGMPIGGVLPTNDVVIPNAVGVDIGCGMRAVKTNIRAEMIEETFLRKIIMRGIRQRIPLGMDHHKERQDEKYMPVGFDIDSMYVVKHQYISAQHQVGTLGGGNHFIELQKDGEGWLWIMIHSGSRNLGKRIEEHYHRLAAKHCGHYRVRLPDPDLAFLPIEEPDGHNYFRDMLLALRYAEENRRRMMAAFKETVEEFAPEASFVRELDVHHNYAAFEEHFGRKVCVHRKGATSAKRGELGIIPGSMGAASYIVRGLGNPDSFESCSHGAGRKMSRIAACTTLTPEQCDAALDGIVYERWHPYKKFGKAKGRLDLSEAPQAYKDIEDVIRSERDLVEPLVRLVPMSSLKG